MIFNKLSVITANAKFLACKCLSVKMDSYELIYFIVLIWIKD